MVNMPSHWNDLSFYKKKIFSYHVLLVKCALCKKKKNNFIISGLKFRYNILLFSTFILKCFDLKKIELLEIYSLIKSSSNRWFSLVLFNN